MKKVTLLLSLIMVFLSFGSADAQVRIIAVDTDADQITLKNFGDAAVDVFSYQICTLASRYDSVHTLTASTDLILGPDEELVLNRELHADTSDVALYSNADNFGSAANIVDFMQYGSGGNGRESVAVAAGIWTAGEYVTGGSPFTYIGDGKENGASSWEGTLFGNVRIFLVDAINNQITLKNFGNDSVDVSNYQICNLKSYAPVSILTDSSLTLAPGQQLVLNHEIHTDTSDVALYSNSRNFGSAENLVDFMQFGSGGNGRESVAVEAGIWTAGEYVKGGSPFTYTGDGDQNGASYWEGTLAGNVRIIFVDSINDQITLKNFGNIPVDVSSYQICTLASRYDSVHTLTESTDLILDPDDELVLNREINADTSDVALYSNADNFSSADNIVDFMQFGSSGNGRDSVAVAAGIWNADEFVGGNSPFTYTGNGNQNGASYWEGTVVSNEDEGFNTMPDEISLSQNFPNPFNPSTNISFTITEPGFVSLAVYDVLGRQVGLLVNETKPIGEFTVSFDARDLSSGLYIYQLRTAGTVINRQMTLIK